MATAKKKNAYRMHDAEYVKALDKLYGKEAKSHEITERSLSYRFYLHEHPYVPHLLRELMHGSVRKLQAADTSFRKDLDLAELDTRKPVEADYALYKDFFDAKYHPDKTVVEEPYPVLNIDFSTKGAYSIYNWELFYHVPMAIAMSLSKNQRFEEAQKWFHFIFDPTDNSNGPTPERFWKVKPFQTTEVKRLEDLLVNLSTNVDEELREETEMAIRKWKDNPFLPHAVARYRPQAYMYHTVMAYLDNLIDWGDSLFRQDTGESIDEARMLYVLAASILGPKPQAVPKKGTITARTYAQMKDHLDLFSNAMEEMESDILFDLSPPSGPPNNDPRFRTLGSIGHALYFCVPRNDKLLGYWTTVADRLFKIRNSLNLQGVFRQLPLFEPPIDPALLAKAAAAGLSIDAIIAGLEQPLPLVRFKVLIQKAQELCQEVKSLGSQLLSAMEKHDGEALSIIRAQHETVILNMVEAVKYGQWQESLKSLEGVEQSFANAKERYVYYERLLGNEKAADVAEKLDALDKEKLSAKKLKAKEPVIDLAKIDIDSTEGEGGIMLNRYESQDMALSDQAQGLRTASAVTDLIASVLGLVPQFAVDGKPLGVGAGATFGGVELSKMTSMMSSAMRIGADIASNDAAMASKMGGYARRQQEWQFQSNSALGEINQLYKQWRGAQIREAVAYLEWGNHKKQMEHAKRIEEFLSDEKKGKRTNQALYAWMKRETQGLYNRCFQFAFDMAKKAERALQHELGDTSVSFIQYGYMAGREGFLAGEKLHLDIKRLEVAYMENDRREYELTQSVSLLQLDAAALMDLRQKGSCTFTIPESLLDRESPGHYFRRIRSVALSLPCVTGPYVGVNCRLTQLSGVVRKNTGIDEGYARTGPEDSRFDEYSASVNTMVASTAQNDAGMFETNLRDERYLPFEGSGVISTWRLDLPADPSEGKDKIAAFDYSTISDAVLHIRYTAREGGDKHKQDAKEAVITALKEDTNSCTQLFPVRQQFAQAWQQFKALPGGNGPKRLVLDLDKGYQHFPYWAKELVGGADITNVQAWSKDDKGKIKALTEKIAPLNGKLLRTLNIDIDQSGEDKEKMTELWVNVAWNAGA